MKEAMEKILQEKFNHSSFRPGQAEAIESILQKRDTLVMLPTGVGKSLCYQLPAYLLEGAVLVVSPLLSLMQDQVESLKAMGESKVVAVNSETSSWERTRIFRQLNHYRFIYTSPEMLQNPQVIQALRSIKVSIFVIDEAHCISHWGTDFRPDYLVLASVRQQLNNPPTMALTATATPEVRAEIIRFLNLDLNQTKQIIQSVDRPEIKFVVEHCHGDKNQRLISYLKQLKGPGIIYFMSKKLADQWADFLNKELDILTASYHSSIAADDKNKIQQQFLENKLTIICATSAFGMGFDKKDIRFVIHYHLPASAEMYLQEVGRASRDGEESLALLLYQPGDEQIQWHFIEESLPDNQLLEQIKRNEKLAADTNEVLVKLAQYYLSLTNNLEQAQTLVEERKKIKEKQLYFMLDYIHQNQCKRNLLLNYFSEEKTSQIKECCSACGLDINSFIQKLNQLKRQPEKTNTLAFADWQVILKSLYNMS